MAYLRLIEFAKPTPAEHRLARTRRGGNQAVTIDRTLMKVSASPVPISTRAVTASGSVVASASTS